MQLRPYKDVVRANFCSHNVILVLNLFSKEEKNKVIVKYYVHVLRAPCGGPVLYILFRSYILYKCVSGGNNIMPDTQMLKEHYNRRCSLTLWGKTVQ